MSHTSEKLSHAFRLITDTRLSRASTFYWPSTTCPKSTKSETSRRAVLVGWCQYRVQLLVQLKSNQNFWSAISSAMYATLRLVLWSSSTNTLLRSDVQTNHVKTWCSGTYKCHKASSWIGKRSECKKYLLIFQQGRCLAQSTSSWEVISLTPQNQVTVQFSLVH